MFCCSIATMLLLFYNYINPALSRKLYGILLAENTLLTDFGNFVFYFLTILEPFFDQKKRRFHDLISVFVCFFLFVFVMATSHSIRPPTLIFDLMWLRKRKKKCFFFIFIFHDFRANFHVSVFEAYRSKYLAQELIIFV